MRQRRRSRTAPRSFCRGIPRRERPIETNDQWKCIRNLAYRPLHYSHAQMRGYFVAGPADSVDGTQYPWGWADSLFDDGAWPAGESDPRWNGAPRDTVDAPNRWLLVPRTLPLMEETPQRLAAVRLASGTTVPSSFSAPAFVIHGAAEHSRAAAPGSITSHDGVSGARGLGRHRGGDPSRLRGSAVRGSVEGCRQGEPERSRGQDVRRVLRHVHERWRCAPPVSPALVAHVPLHRSRHSDEGRAAHGGGPSRRLHGLSLSDEGALRRLPPSPGLRRASRPAVEDARGRLAHGAALRA